MGGIVCKLRGESLRFDEKVCTDGIERVKLKMFVGGSSSVYCGIGF